MPTAQQTQRSGRDIWSCDWSGQHGVTIFDGLRVHVVATMLDVLPLVGKNATVVVESTFESYNVDRRQEMIDAFHTAGVELLILPSRRTAGTRAKLFPEAKKADLSAEDGDMLDAVTIWLAATESNELLLSPPPLRKTPQHVQAARADLMQTRRTYELRPTTSGRFVGVSEKEKLAKRVNGLLPVPPAEYQRYLGKLGPKGRFDYKAPQLAAVIVACRHARSRRKVEQILGAYSHAYPSQFRSDMFWWTWKMMLRHDKNPETLSLAEWQRARRWLIHRVLELPISEI